MIHVMIAEDDPMVMDITARYTHNTQGFSVVAKSTNGRETLDILNSSQPDAIDLLILDNYMPFIEGLEVLRSLRHQNNNIDVIFLTAANSSSIIEAALKLGIIDYLVKPFGYERFRTALEKYRQRRQILRTETELTQSKLDQVLGTTLPTEQFNTPKGIQTRTLENIKAYMLEHITSFISADDLAQELGMSRVTVRRYMEYLESIGEAAIQVEYGTIGRPSHLYRLIQ